VDNRGVRTIAPILLVGALVTGCGADDPTVAGGGQPRPTPSSEAPSSRGSPSSPSATTVAPGGTTITTGDSDHGPMLFNADGQAIYIWEVETSARPECYGDCASAWPPVLTRGQPLATGGVMPSLLGTTRRTDGTTQVTYAGHPLYYYAHEGPNEVKCHNVSTHGGLWWVVTPEGTRAD
jgi:predicted lipoprotein with Yx(FWY)xxD motif